MSEKNNEPQTVQASIAEGQPPGNGGGAGAIPRGVEVLLKKAAVDAEFRERLLAERGSAAAAIELELDPAERAMLEAIPREQLENIVAQTVVPVEQRRVFLGRLAAPMLAVLGVAVTGCPAKPTNVTPLGARPDTPPTNQPPAKAQPTVPPSTNSPPSPPGRGIQPDRP